MREKRGEEKRRVERKVEKQKGRHRDEQVVGKRQACLHMDG